MKTSDLTCAALDYWTARAEGVPDDRLEMRQGICMRLGFPINTRDMRLDYSTNWALAGPLIKTYGIDLENPVDPVPWCAKAWANNYWFEGVGDDPMVAICRAVVRSAFGDEVEDLPCE